jgi:hypothetical protein
VFRKGAPAAIHLAGGFKVRKAQHLSHDFWNDHRADVAAQALMVAVAEEEVQALVALGVKVIGIDEAVGSNIAAWLRVSTVVPGSIVCSQGMPNPSWVGYSHTRADQPAAHIA